MIYAVIGQTGSGKSGFVFRKIETWLRTRQECRVVTNLALDVEEFCQYLQEEYGETFDAAERIQLLDLDQIADFYRFYGKGYTIPAERSKIIKMGDGEERECQDYDGRHKAGWGVLYAIDEADEIFDAKRYAKIVHDLRFYTRHQRKFSDDVYFCAPSWDFLVKELRVQCHAVWSMENQAQLALGKIPLVGIAFKQLAKIKARQYKVRPGGAWGGLDKPRSTESYSIQPKGIDRCYRTEDGLGVKGIGVKVRVAEKAKGFHPAWAAVACVLVILAIPSILNLGSKLFGGAVVGVATKAGAAAHQAATNEPPQGGHHSMIAAQRKTEPSAAAELSNSLPIGNRHTSPDRAVSDTNQVYCTGFMPGKRPGELIFILSDGRTVSSKEPGFQGKLLNHFGNVIGCRIGGEKYAFK